MIENDIINWLEISESMKYIDIYGKPSRVKYFKLIHTMMNFKTFGSFWYLLLTLFYFLQVMMLVINDISESSDYSIILLKYISNIFLINEYLSNESFYSIVILVLSILTLVIILIYIYIQISLNLGKFYIRLPVTLLNYFNILLLDYLIGPIIMITLLSTKCDENNEHVLLHKKCFKDVSHLTVVVFSLLNLLFYLFYSFFLAMYYNEVGAVNENKLSSRINCNYELFIHFFKCSLFILTYFNEYYQPNNKILRIIIQVYVCLFTTLLCIYCYYEVLFYNNTLNIINLYGNAFIAWYTLGIILKEFLDINETSVLHILGWIIISIILFLLEDDRNDFLLTDFNIFQANSLKKIELFVQQLYNLISVNSIKNKTLLVGMIEKFETYFKRNYELNVKYTKLHEDEIVNKKITNKLELKILSIVYLIYEYHLNQDKFKNDILIILSYFLMNKFKKPTLAIYFCSKITVNNHKFLYLKFVLMEEIKDYLVFKITKATEMDTMSHIQISSMILYYIYEDLFKIKIYDAICSQIEYFEHLTNQNIDSKITQNFLKTGDDILLLRKKIMKLWEKIFQLNIYNEDCKKNYITIYLEKILQDDDLAKIEEKRIDTARKKKESEKTNLIYDLFKKEQSSILLIDGYLDMGRILYVTPNFQNVFDYSNNELMAGKIDNLLPKTIAEFHNELIENSIKFSRLEKIFKKPLETSIKGKKNGLFTVDIYIKTVPNFKFGLIYICYLKKISTNTFNIMLDKNLKITCYTDLGKEGNNSLNSQFFGKKLSLTNRNICVFIPEILKQIQYKDESYSFLKNDIDLEGNFYPIENINEVETKVNLIIEKIKQTGYLKMNEEGDNQDTFKDYDELMFMIRKRYTKGSKIFYKIKTKIFLNKYIIHLFQMSNDLARYNNKETIENSLKNEKDKKDKDNSESNSNDQNINIIQLENVKIDGDADKYKDNKEGSSSRSSKNSKKKKKKKAKTITKNGEEGETPEDIKNNENKKTNEEKNEEENDNENESLKVQKNINMDISTYKKLKSRIIKGEEVSWMIIMKYVGLAFGIISLLFCYLFYTDEINNLKRINEYCDQNLVFNHSKISLACIYLVTKNLYYTKFKYIENSSCYGHDSCKDFYLETLSLCLNDLERITQNISFFHQDFIDIFYQSVEVNLMMYYNYINEGNFNITKANLLMLILSTSLDYSSNIDNYFNITHSIYDIMNINIGSNSLNLFNDKTLVGFNKEKKRKNLSDLLNNYNDYAFILELCIFIIFSSIFGILIYQVNKIELEYIRALIRFNSKDFEEYLTTTLFGVKELIMNNSQDDILQNKNEDGENQSHKNHEEGGADILNNNLKIATKGSQLFENKAPKITDLGEFENEQKTKDHQENTKKEEEKRHRKKNKGGKKGKFIGIKNLKIQAMSKYFKQMNIVFVIKVVVIFFITFSYFFVLIILEDYYEQILLNFDEIINEIEGVYKDGFQNLILLKNITSSQIEYEIEIDKAEYYFKLYSTYTINNIIYTKENITSAKDFSLVKNILNDPSTIILSELKLGNSLMTILNDEGIDSNLREKINILYNGNSCSALFLQNETVDNYIKKYSQKDYDNCTVFWSAILIKGMEQSMTQMIIEKNSVLDELTALYRRDKNITDIMNINSSYRRFEFFLLFYFLRAFWDSSYLFDEIKNIIINNINRVYLIITIVYMGITLFLILILRHVISNSRKVFNSFLSFIVILPAKFVDDDPYFLEEILKLEEKLY